VVAEWGAAMGIPAANEEAAAAPMPALLGVYYPIRRNFSTRIWPGMVAGEMFRSGSGWWWPDDWGVWTRISGGEIAIRIDGAGRPVRALFRLRGVTDKASDWTLEFAAPSAIPLRAGRLGPDERRWVAVDFPPQETGLTIQARLRGVETQDLASRTDGLDCRITSIGLEGFFLYDTRDLEARINFTEALATDTLERLTPGYDAQWS
jgi:hypothetical protein